MEIFRTKFGSHLYGTQGPNSDTDYKAVVLPSWTQVALSKVPKGKNESTGDQNTKNGADDVDIEHFTIHQFVKLALEGQTVAMDMIHVPESFAEVWHEIWADLIANRSKFYSRNIESFVGYAQKQAAKYGVKGSRLNDAKAVLDWVQNQIDLHPLTGKDLRLIDCDMTTFPKGEHIQYVLAPIPGGNNVFAGGELFNALDMVEVCQRKILLNSKLPYVHDMIKKFYDAYGDRAKQAANDEGIDWKAISHAFRAAYQVRELLTSGTITFPRPEAEFLKEIKFGRISYKVAAPILEDLIDEVKALRETSTLPDRPDHEFWEKWLVRVVEDHVVPVGDIVTRQYWNEIFVDPPTLGERK